MYIIIILDVLSSNTSVHGVYNNEPHAHNELTACATFHASVLKHSEIVLLSPQELHIYTVKDGYVYSSKVLSKIIRLHALASHEVIQHEAPEPDQIDQ
jgi:hypothetical protein